MHSVTLDKFYKFFNMVIKPFDGTNTIYTPIISATITEIDDIPDLTMDYY